MVVICVKRGKNQCKLRNDFRGYIETLGIPIDPPYLIFGSEPRHAHLSDYQFYTRKFKEFGTKTYGKYDGVFPTIVTIDPELVKSVCSKNFDCFPAIVDMPVSQTKYSV